MSLPLFIGDQLTATGFRLPGVRVVAPPPEKIADVFERSLSDAPLVIITTAIATALPEDRLLEAVRHARPPVAVVPDARSTLPFPDMATRVSRALGVEG
jgi:vacuolar-type H+-ATPase subunit F/Vma7